MSQMPPGSMGAPFVGEALQFLEDPFAFTLSRTRQHRCAGEALIQLVVPAFLGWFTRRYDLTYPPQDASPGSGGLGPLPKSQLRVKIARR